MEKNVNNNKNENNRNDEKLAWTFGALALLFQPFIKIALGRLIWNVVDVVVAVGVSILCVGEYKRKIKL